MIVCPGQRRPDNMGVKTYLQFSIFCHGTWLTQEPPCRLQQFAFFNLSIFNQFTALRSFLIGELQSISELIPLQSYHLWPGVLFLVCTNDTFQVNNSKSFSKQVCPSCRFDKMVGTPRGMPFQAVLLTFDLISEFTHFNLVIRLSKVEQLAFFHLFTCRSMLC